MTIDNKHQEEGGKGTEKLTQQILRFEIFLSNRTNEVK